MYCVSCGRELGDGANFCPGCGTRQRPATPSPNANDNRTTAPSPNTSGNPAAASRPNANSNPATFSKPNAKSKPATTSSPNGPDGRKRRIVAIISAIVAIALVVIIAIVAVNVKSASDAEALRVATSTLVQPWQDRVDAVSTNATDRTVMLAAYNELEATRSSIELAQTANELTLPNGAACDLSDVFASIDDKEAAIRAWFAANYESRLAAATLPEGASASNTTRETAQAAADALATLRADIEAEKVIWGQNAATAATSGATYTNILSRIDAQVKRANEVLAAIQAAEDAAAQAAAEAAAQAAADRTFDCDYFTIVASEPWAPSGSTSATLGTNDYFYCGDDITAQYTKLNSHYAYAHNFRIGDNGGFVIMVMTAGFSDNLNANGPNPYHYLGTTSGGNYVWISGTTLEKFQKYFSITIK